MKYRIYTPFHDDATIDNKAIRYINISNGQINVIIINFDWSFLEITSTDYVKYDQVDEDDTEFYGIRSGTFKKINEKDEPIWEALTGNMVEHDAEEDEEESNVIPLIDLRSIEEDD